jgi:CO/xanthine dehydrogenase Mo-binding subunit
MGAFGIGQPLSRFEDGRLLRGGGMYVADRVLPGQVYACFLRSPHAHAAIGAIELENARNAAGVVGVFVSPTWRWMVWVVRLSPSNDLAQTACRCSGGLIQALQRHASDMSEILSRWSWPSL